MIFREFKILSENQDASAKKCATPPQIAFQSLSAKGRGTTVGSLNATGLRFGDNTPSLPEEPQYAYFPRAAPAATASTTDSTVQFNAASPSMCPTALTSSLLFTASPTLQRYSPTFNSPPVMQIPLSTAVEAPGFCWTSIDPAGAQWLRFPLPLTQTSLLNSPHASLVPMVAPLTRDCQLGIESSQATPAMSYHSGSPSRHCVPVISHGAPVPLNATQNARKSKGRRKLKTKPAVQQQPQPVQRSVVPSISELFPGISSYHGPVPNPLGRPAPSNQAVTAHSSLLDAQQKRQLPPLNLPASQPTSFPSELSATQLSTRTSANKSTPHGQDVTEHPTPARTCCSPCSAATSSVWELCQPVRCIIDQNEVEIIPGTGTSRGSECRNSEGTRKRHRRVPRRQRRTNSPDAFHSPQNVGFSTSLLTAIT